MPRRAQNPPEDRDHWRDLFVARIKEEQERRGLSDAQVAYKAAVYVPMTSSTIWKIKNAVPSRRIDLDEARALMLAFEFDSFDDFLTGHQPLSKVKYLALKIDEDLQASAAVNERTLATVQEMSDTVSANAPFSHNDMRFLEPLDAAAWEHREQAKRIFKEVNALVRLATSKAKQPGAL